MTRIKLLSDVSTQLLATELKREFEVVEAPGAGGYVKELLEPSISGCDFTVLALYGESAVEPPPGTIVVSAPSGAKFRDERMMQLAFSPWSLAGLKYLAARIRGAVAVKKVLALDYDNTLWRGIAGEDGADAVVPETGLQSLAKELEAGGVLLVGLSRNNAGDVAPVWRRPDMVLKEDDFILQYVDWEEKSRNLERAAAKLNLGTESFVFVDDRAVERAKMLDAHPEVAVFSPDGLSAIRGAFRADGASRTASYRAQFSRYGEYLETLGIETEIHDIREDEFARVAELSQRANQFNFTTRRWTAEEVRKIAATPGTVFKTLRSRDRHGDLGLVGYAVASGGRITDFVLSCRAMNRGHERELFEAMGALPMDFVATPRNAPAQKFFEEISQ